ncbi:MAG: zinc-dependent alcohol dehydrogenase family protein [Hyphomonadaceae bacterium]|nr:zinc-dependent alcohol dehydrogenase family protein [Hyphomonadaceae bacterium]
MRAMRLERTGEALIMRDLPDPEPEPGEVRIQVRACGVCRTDLHVVDGDLPERTLPMTPGHEIVGVIDRCGDGVSDRRIGARVGVGWLGGVCGSCRYCAMQRENLCDAPQFTGYTRDGGFATYVIADARFVYDLPDGLGDDASAAPLLCAGLIGWRSLIAAGDGRALGLYGFGAAAHIILQIGKWQGRRVFVFTRANDRASQAFARSLGADWVGASDETPPHALDAAIIFAPVGALVPKALRAVRKGGRVVCAGIHMSDIPAFAYALLWGERALVSVANLTRRDAAEFLALAPRVGVKTHIARYRLGHANQALDDLRAGRLQGAAVLTMETGNLAAS